MPDVLNALIARDFDDIQGASVVGSIPITESVLNQLASEQIARARGRIQQFDIQIGAGNYLELGVKVAVGPLSKWFRPEFQIEAHPQPPAVTLTLASSGYSGLLWLVDLFAQELLPAGVAMQDRQIRINLAEVPELGPYKGLLRCLRRFDIQSIAAKMTIDFELMIDERGKL